MASRGVLNVGAIQTWDADRNFEAIGTAMTMEMFCRQFIDGEGIPDSDAANVSSAVSLDSW